MSDILKILLVCALVVLLATIGFAYVRSSANYDLAADTTDQGGGKASSANYTIQPGAAGQSTPTGTSGSTNYLLKGGYVYIESSGDSQGPTVEVTSPIGGELWKGGSTHNITFTATDGGGLKANSLYAWYSTDGGGTFPNLITREAIITSPFVWNIPNSINSQTVRVRLNIWDADNNIGTAESPASFTIDSTPPTAPVLLTPPNGSSTNDATTTFTWNAATDVTSGVASYEVVIDTTQITTLGAVTTFTTADAESQGWHNWKVRAKDNAQNWGLYSDTWNLTIETTNPTVTLGQPRGGVTLEAGSSYNITWEAADANGLKTNPVTLYFSSNAGSSWSTIQAGIPYGTGEGTYSWTIADVNSSQCLVSIEVEDQAGNKAYDISDSGFTISNTLPTATVLYPNGGEYLKGSTSYNITWVATGEVLPVTINLRYSVNSGGSWTLIASNESNDGTYAWTTPLIDSTTCRVSVEATDGLSRVATDQSNADFAIDSTTPEVTVVAPAGGERIAGGSSYNVQWTATDPVGLPINAITLRYSTDSGGTWNLIAAGRPNTSPYSWTVPLANSTTCRVSVEAIDYVGNTDSAVSASDFTIDSTTPTVTSITPTNGATSVPINTQVVIVFSKEMSREVTENAFSLTASPAVAGGFSWSSDGKTLTFTPAAALEYNILYTVGVAATTTDMVGNHLSAFSTTFTTAQRGDTEAPHIIIQRVDSQGVANTLKDGDYIPKQPKFKGEITDNLGVSRATIKFYLDDVEVSATITEISATKFEISYTVTSNLEGETVKTHSVKLTASDTAGNSSTKEIKELKVSYESGKVVGPVLTYPTTYDPLTGQPARIAYNLTADQDIMIYLFDISGQNVWTGKYPSGTEGGKAGYNDVLFYGRSDISSSYLGNGIYVYKLVAGGKIIGTGRMAIF